MQGKKPLNIAIGRRIQQSREQAGLTQEELAERIDRSTQFISTIERGLKFLEPPQSGSCGAGPSFRTPICWQPPLWKSSPGSPLPSCFWLTE